MRWQPGVGRRRRWGQTGDTFRRTSIEASPIGLALRVTPASLRVCDAVKSNGFRPEPRGNERTIVSQSRKQWLLVRPAHDQIPRFIFAWRGLQKFLEILYCL